jgi:alpha-D-ribose 1-methylphosphonate 5-triphosphate diphosphatase
MRMPDRGNIAPGRRADLVFINKESRRIEATVSDGCLSFVAGDAAYRFISANLTNHSTAVPYAAQ